MKTNINQRTLEYIDRAIVDLDNEIAAINKELDSLRVADLYNDDTNSNLETVEGAFAFFKENFDTLSIENKRNFLKRCISKIMWDGESLHIFTQKSVN